MAQGGQRGKPKPPSITSGKAALAGKEVAIMPGRLTPFLFSPLTGKSVALQASTNLTGTGTGGPLPPASGDTDFAYRRGDTRPNSGVVRWHKFNSTARDPSTYDKYPSAGYNSLGQQIIGSIPGFTVTYGWEPEGATASDGTRGPYLDTAVKVSGDASMRLDILPGDTTGVWQPGHGFFLWQFSPPSPNTPVRFDVGSKFYFQFRIRHSDGWINTDLAGQGGPKHLILTADGPVGAHDSDSMQWVIVDYGRHHMPVTYGGVGASTNGGFYDSLGGGDYWLQDGMVGCTYHASFPVSQESPAACFSNRADEWATYKILIDLTDPGCYRSYDGTRYWFERSKFKFWAGHEGEALQLLVDWDPDRTIGYKRLEAGNTGTAKWGKAWLNCQTQELYSNPSRAVMSVWYDELIVSTEDIPDPGVFHYPAWREDKPVNTWFELLDPATAQMSGYIWPPPPTYPGNISESNRIIDAWNSFARLGNVWYSSGAGGHGDWQNATLALDLSLNNPAWVLVHPGSTPDGPLTPTYEQKTDPNYIPNMMVPYYRDGLPVSTHTYWAPQPLEAQHAFDGKARIMRIGDGPGAYGASSGIPGAYTGGPYINGFRVDDNAWDPAGTWPAQAMSGVVPVARDPATGVYYLGAGNQIDTFNPTTKVYTSRWAYCRTSPPPLYPNTGYLQPWQGYPAIVDTTRNWLVCINSSTEGRSGNGNPHMQMIYLQNPPTAILTRELVGYPTGFAAYNAYFGFVHDLDNDRYLVTFQSQVWAVDPNTDPAVCTFVCNLPSAPVNGAFNRFEYFPDLGGVAYMARWSSHVAFMPTR